MANMSHELEHLLTGIIGFTDLLMKTNREIQQKTYDYRKSISGIIRIVNDILDFSKM
jgi:signal transduction histidine kinase